MINIMHPRSRWRSALIAGIAWSVCAGGATASAAESASSPDPGFAPEPAWVRPALDQVQLMLKSNPPSYPPSKGRVEALSVLDGPLHLQEANRFRSVHDFLLNRLTDTVSEIEATRVTTGAMIWKIYNHGFVIRTPSVTLGMDLVRGWRVEAGGKQLEFGLTPELTNRLARQIDVLTVSHVHGDHQDFEMLKAMLAAGTPVLADPSAFADAEPHPLLIRPPRLPREVAADPTTSPAFMRLNTRAGTSVDYLVYPGRQAPATVNNVFLLRSPEGMTFMHTGDQDWNPDTIWMENVARQQPVDVLLVNCWSSNLNTLVLGSRPSLVIMGHENEMNHTPAHREAFWRSFQCFRPLGDQPYHVLCWGEGVRYAAGTTTPEAAPR